MADAAPLLPGLPDDTAIWEILIRLPPKPLLRCRAVSPAWRRAVSSRDFLLAHHARQPALPILYSSLDDVADIVPFDHRAAGVAAADRFQSVARLKPAPSDLYVKASRDGLLLLSHALSFDLSICNPATRQLKGFYPLEMYPHHSTGEYRLLLWRPAEDGAYVFTLGSAQPPRHIGCPRPLLLEDSAGLLFQGIFFWMDQGK